MTILITGGCGYIGSHVAWALTDAGHDIMILDDLSTGHRENAPPSAEVRVGDVGDEALLTSLFAEKNISAVMHFAGRILPAESLRQPLNYFRENTAKAITLLSVMVRAKVPRMVFSSTAAVYGLGGSRPVSELDPLDPLSPYGQSKAMTESIISATCAAHGLVAVSLRYFNVAGADALGRCGPRGPNPGHLIRTAVDVTLGRRQQLQIYGSDFSTPDGTGVRDYIHVSDLANAHLAVLNHLQSRAGYKVFNCGYGRGASVLEIVKAVETATQRSLPHEFVSRRAGDPESIVSDPTSLLALGTWHATHDSLSEIIQSTLNFERRK